MARDEYLNSLYSLEGQVAVVTGGTGLLGGAMAMALAMAGARVGILGRRASVAEETAAAIQARGGEAIAIPADVLDRDSLSMARDKLLKHWGAVHTVVNAEDTQDALSIRRALVEQQVELAKPRLGPHLAWPPADRVTECRTLKRKGVKLSVFSGRINARSPYLVKKSLVDNPPQP